MSAPRGEMTSREAGKLGGRPTLLTDRLQRKVCALIEETACSLYTAGLSLDVDPVNLYNWEQWGRAGRQPYRTFLERVMQARAKAELRLLRAYNTDCERGREGTNGRGQAWLLERRFPEEYDNRFKFDKQLAELSPEQLDEYIDTCDAVFGESGEALEGEPLALTAGTAGDGTGSDSLLSPDTDGEAAGVPGADV